MHTKRNVNALAPHMLARLNQPPPSLGAVRAEPGEADRHHT